MIDNWEWVLYWLLSGTQAAYLSKELSKDYRVLIFAYMTLIAPLITLWVAFDYFKEIHYGN